MKRIETEQVARDVIKVMTPVILEQTSTTRRCFHGSLVRVDGKWELRGCITAERIGPDGWQEIDGEKLSQLKAGEIRKLNLGREQVRNLSSGLNALTEYAENHEVELGLADLVIARRENIVEVGNDRRATEVVSQVEDGAKSILKAIVIKGIVVLAVPVTSGHADGNLLAPKTPQGRIILGVCIKLCLCALMQFLITVLTLWQVGSVYIRSLQKGPSKFPD